MGRRGPAAQPTAMKQLAGVRDDRINHLEPTPRAGWPEAPADISEASLTVWWQLHNDLEGTGHVAKVDGDLLRVFCDLVVRYREAEALLADTGILIEKRGFCKHKTTEDCDAHACIGTVRLGYVTNPLVKQIESLAAQLRIYARSFGLTPSARASIVDPSKGKGGADPYL